MKRCHSCCLLSCRASFGSVWHKGILYKQTQINKSWWITKWTSSFLSNKKLKLKYNQAISKSFTRSRGHPREHYKHLGSEDLIIASKKVKFLGLDLNYKLTWTNHVIKIVVKKQQKINMLRHPKSKNIKPKIIMYLYQTMVRPLYLYANAAWANVTKSDLNKIQKEQSKAIRLAYNLPMWTSVDELHQKGKLRRSKKCNIKIKLRIPYKGYKTKKRNYKKHNRKTFANLEPDQIISNSLQIICKTFYKRKTEDRQRWGMTRDVS